MKQKIGILGGTFNPPHKGHLQMASYAYEKLCLDEIMLIPDNLPPHKNMPRNTPSAFMRLDMTKLAFQHMPFAKVSDMEIKKGGTSYTFETLRELRQLRKDCEFYLLMGSDMFLSFDTWKSADGIAAMCILVVFDRETEDKSRILEKQKALNRAINAQSIFLDTPVIEISSTEIRSMDKNERSKWVPEDVSLYIEKYKLYS